MPAAAEVSLESERYRVSVEAAADLSQVSRGASTPPVQHIRAHQSRHVTARWSSVERGDCPTRLSHLSSTLVKCVHLVDQSRQFISSAATRRKTFLTRTRPCCAADIEQVGVTCVVLDHSYLSDSHSISSKERGYICYPTGKFSHKPCSVLRRWWMHGWQNSLCTTVLTRVLPVYFCFL